MVGTSLSTSAVVSLNTGSLLEANSAPSAGTDVSLGSLRAHLARQRVEQKLAGPRHLRPARRGPCTPPGRRRAIRPWSPPAAPAWPLPGWDIFPTASAHRAAYRLASRAELVKSRLWPSGIRKSHRYRRPLLNRGRRKTPAWRARLPGPIDRRISMTNPLSCRPLASSHTANATLHCQIVAAGSQTPADQPAVEKPRRADCPRGRGELDRRGLFGISVEHSAFAARPAGQRC